MLCDMEKKSKRDGGKKVYLGGYFGTELANSFERARQTEIVLAGYPISKNDFLSKLLSKQIEASYGGKR